MQKLDEEPIEPKDDNFGCVQCGKCCTYHSDNIFEVTTFDIKRIKRATGLKESEFTEVDYRRIVRVLKTVYDPKDGEFYCMFLKKKRDGTTYCEIYDYRPSQCRYYPFGGLCQNGRRIQKGLRALGAMIIRPWV